MRHRVTVHGNGTTIVLPCGVVVEGRPHDTAGYAATARDLGYGDDVLAMCRDHDALHAALADWIGVESFALREAAGLDGDPVIAAAEESAVLAVQRWMSLAGGRLALG